MNAQDEWQGEGGFAGRGADGEPLGAFAWWLLGVVAGGFVIAAVLTWLEASAIPPAPADVAAELAGGAR